MGRMDGKGGLNVEIVIWLVGLEIPVAAFLFMFGYTKGLFDSSAICNWGIGFDDGWKAYEELVIETGRANHGLDRTESGN